jgi:hypothetical protein
VIPLVRTTDTDPRYLLTQAEVDRIKETEWWWYECTAQSTTPVLVSTKKKTPTAGGN